MIVHLQNPYYCGPYEQIVYLIPQMLHSAETINMPEKNTWSGEKRVPLIEISYTEETTTATEKPNLPTIPFKLPSRGAVVLLFCETNVISMCRPFSS
jgi:hypothetical protein